MMQKMCWVFTHGWLMHKCLITMYENLYLVTLEAPVSVGLQQLYASQKKFWKKLTKTQTMIAALCAKKIRETEFDHALEIKMKLLHALSDVGYMAITMSHPFSPIDIFCVNFTVLTKCGYWCG